MTKPDHHGIDFGSHAKVPNFQENVKAVLKTPTGTFVVRMMRGQNVGWWGHNHQNPYHWSIETQPEELHSRTTSPRPEYAERVSESPSSYNEYHRAINYLEDRLYAEQNSG